MEFVLHSLSATDRKRLLESLELTKEVDATTRD